MTKNTFELLAEQDLCNLKNHLSSIGTKKGKNWIVARKNKFVNEFIAVLATWTKKERHLELPIKVENNGNRTFILANKRAIYRLTEDSVKEWINCEDEPGYGFKRSNAGSTRNKSSYQEFSSLEMDSAMTDSSFPDVKIYDDELAEFRANVDKIENLVILERNPEKVKTMLEVLNFKMIEAIFDYRKSDFEVSEVDSMESKGSVYEDEPEIKKSKCDVLHNSSHLDTFMNRSLKRMVGIPMQTLILKLMVQASLSSKQIWSCINIIQESTKIWDEAAFEKGMPCDRTIRNIANRLLEMHHIFVKEFLAEAESFYICTDGARQGFIYIKRVK